MRIIDDVDNLLVWSILNVHFANTEEFREAFLEERILFINLVCEQSCVHGNSQLLPVHLGEFSSPRLLAS